MNKTQIPNKKSQNTKLQYQRELKGWSQEYVGEKIGTTAKNVSRWECGDKPVPYYRQKLMTLFGVKDAAELGFVDLEKTKAPDGDPQEDSAPEVPLEEARLSQGASTPIHIIIAAEGKGIDVDTLRRGLIQMLGVGAATLIVAPHKIYSEYVSGSLNEHLVALLESEMIVRWSLYYTAGAASTSIGLEVWMKEMSGLAHASRGTLWHERVLVLLTMSYQLQGCVLRDTMRYPEAYKAFRKAFLIAQEVYDSELMASALVREGITLNHQDNPHEAILCFNHALETIKRLGYHTLEGYILQGLSEAQAKAQQSQECWCSLGWAEETLGRGDATMGRSLARLNISSLTAQRGVNAALLQDHEQAIQLIDRSLKSYEPSLIRGRARLIAQKAEALYLSGRIDECTAAAQKALLLANAAGASRTIVKVSNLHTTLTRSKWSKEQGTVQLGMVLSREA